jgi:DNA-binding protein YbaB
MEEIKDQIHFIFNVNCNCKKTLKRISIEPDKVIDTEKELIYVFIIHRTKRKEFVSELNNLRLPFLQRVV